MAKALILLLICYAIPASGLVTTYTSRPKGAQQSNLPPIVKIVSPSANSAFSLHAAVHYSIAVADKEDGDSRYDEINPKEVLLQVRFIHDPSVLENALNKPVTSDAPGLAILRSSNCFNCHSFDSKVIGPSFKDINRKYPSTRGNIDLLVKSIAEGSSGVWGNVPMPKHPEFTREEIREMVQWMLQLKAQPDMNYYVGLEGSFVLDSIRRSSNSGLYLLTASYLDHGLGNSGGRLKGQHVIMIQGK
jgi:cytochrome c